MLSKKQIRKHQTNLKPAQIPICDDAIIVRHSVRFASQTAVYLIPEIKDYEDAGIKTSVWNSNKELFEYKMQILNDVKNSNYYDKNISMIENIFKYDEYNEMADAGFFSKNVFGENIELVSFLKKKLTKNENIGG
jgi:hypothetical protein